MFCSKALFRYICKVHSSRSADAFLASSAQASGHASLFWQACLNANSGEMYEQRDNGSDNKSTACAGVKPARLNLAYQWALHLACALGLIHSYSFEKLSPKISIAFGELMVESCRLNASGTSLSLLGFLQSVVRTRRQGPYDGGIAYSGKYFQPRKIGAVPTLETDVFLWGCIVYELMTGFGRGQRLAHEEKETLPYRQEWPRLEAMYLGEVVRKVWDGRNHECYGDLECCSYRCHRHGGRGRRGR